VALSRQQQPHEHKVRDTGEDGAPLQHDHVDAADARVVKKGGPGAVYLPRVRLAAKLQRQLRNHRSARRTHRVAA
jgi:hypothetical protein